MNIQSTLYALLGAFLLFIAGLTVGAIFYPNPAIVNVPIAATRSVKIDKHFTIATFQPVDQPALNEIMQGFEETLVRTGQANYEFRRFNANGDRALLRAQAEEIVSGDYDLVFTAGAACTQTIFELVTKKQKALPVVFAAVDDPIGIGIIKSFESSDNQLTGVIEPHDFATQLAILKYLKPSVKKLLLVYDPAQGTGLEKYKDQIADLATKQNLAFQALPVHEPSQLQERVKSVITNVDAILILKDVGILTARDALVKLCNAYGVTLFASDLNTGEHGAALAYGVKEYDFGIEGAYKAHQILEKNILPAAIASTEAPCSKLLINKSAAAQQKLIIEQALFNVINNCQVIPCS